MELIVKAIVIWLAILCLAVANGALREAILIPHLGKVVGLVLSGVLLSGLILTIAFFTLPWVGARRVSQLVGVGALWLMLTLAFEFLFGFLQGKSWSTMLEAYTFKEGNIWPVVLLVTAAAPYIAIRCRDWLSSR
jgi:hypothetical protein